MAIIRCTMGHFYDDSRNVECPMCRQMGSGMKNSISDDLQKQRTVSAFHLSLAHEREQTASLEMYQKDQIDSERTIGIFSKLKGNDFVTGWLVCVEGPG